MGVSPRSGCSRERVHMPDMKRWMKQWLCLVAASAVALSGCERGGGFKPAKPTAQPAPVEAPTKQQPEKPPEEPQPPTTAPEPAPAPETPPAPVEPQTEPPPQPQIQLVPPDVPELQLPSPDDVPTPQVMLARVKKYVWDQPIGRLFQKYLESDSSNIPTLGHQLLEHIFSERGLVSSRLTALTLLVQDAYDVGLMNAENNSRITMLDVQIQKRAVDLQKTGDRKLIYYAPIFAAFGFLTGSTEFISQMKYLSDDAIQIVRRWLNPNKMRIWQEPAAHAQISRLFGDAFFNNYSWDRAFMFFSHGLMTYMVVKQIQQGRLENSVMEQQLNIEGVSALMQIPEL